MSAPLYSLGPFKAAFAFSQLAPRILSRWLASHISLWSYRRLLHLHPTLRENLHTATGLDGPPLARLERDNIRLFGAMMADYFVAASGDPHRVQKLIGASSGRDHLDTALAQGRGVILITGHIGHWELGGQWLAHCGIPLTVVTLPEPSPALSRWRAASRHRLGIRTIEVGPGRDFAFVEMLRVLRENGVLAVLVDRPYEHTGVAVRQFGRQTSFSSAAAMLAHHSGAPVIPAFVFAREDGRYDSVALPAVELERGPLRQTMQPATQRIATLFEGLIRERPQQWFNYVRLFESGERKAESGKRRAESGERRAESGERRAESGE